MKKENNNDVRMMTYRPLDVFDTSYFYGTSVGRVRDVKTFVQSVNMKKYVRIIQNIRCKNGVYYIRTHA